MLGWLFLSFLSDRKTRSLEIWTPRTETVFHLVKYNKLAEMTRARKLCDLTCFNCPEERPLKFIKIFHFPLFLSSLFEEIF